MLLDNAIVYDIETLPNVFTLTMECLNSSVSSTWEISQYRDDRHELMQWFNWLSQTQTPMIGFNTVHFDYPVIHALFNQPYMTWGQIYDKAQSIIGNYTDRFAHVIWDRDRFAPQIDLFKIHHFDNKAKTTSLKALQINMRSPNVRESRLPFNLAAAQCDIDSELIPYNHHDVTETKRFAFYSMKAIEFRVGLIPQFGIEVMNYNDTKIGEKMLEQRLGDDVCYDRSTGRKTKRQTPRTRIALNDIIFPYIKFQNPEFNRVLSFMKEQVLTPDELTDEEVTARMDDGTEINYTIRTKGVFKNLIANVGGLEFYFGTGGVHASVEKQRFIADENWLIRDIDVEGLYPNIAIVNRLTPEHLGQAFIAEYAKIPDERKTHAKGTYQNAALKLAANGAWGKSNSKFSVFFDPKYAMTIPINGQLMLCMLAEWLLTVPTITLIQANTDGITYRIHRDYLAQAKAIEQQWQDYTCLKLEDAAYSRMWIRDVNNYIAEDTKGKLKQKGAYWHPDPLNYADSISQASPPCWYKDLSNVASTRAAIAAMVHGIDPRTWLMCHSDPFDFVCRVKADRQSRLELGGFAVQNTTRYYVARDGAPLFKISPPPSGHVVGQWKRGIGVSVAEYNRVMQETGGNWDERVCTKSKSRYEDRRTAIQAGWQIAECNDMRSFDFANINYDYYEAEARKLIIS